MKIKVINPNTSWSMTEKIASVARAAAAPGTEIVAVSPAMGPASIETFYDEAFAAVGVVDEIRKGESEGCDGYLIACFGDPGLAAAREVARGPVVGIAEAAMHAASMIGTGFSVISMLQRSRALMEHLVHGYGMGNLCRSIRLVDLPVLDLETEGSAAQTLIVEECRRAIEIDHADCVLLGCGGMANLMALVSREIGAPAIDGVSVGVKFLEVLISLGVTTSKRQGYAFPLAKAYTGIFAPYAPMK